ncbi:MAG: FAD-binding oxidoreductase [Chlamydiales bacterium]|nr:FAD-binding oxidoreductase [Chlamydiales bacterium]
MVSKKVEELQAEIRRLSKEGKRGALCRFGSSNTTRSKSYNKGRNRLDLSSLNSVRLDTQKKVAYAEPSLTMELLVQETLRFGLIPPVVPEFKGISVGGAIMGCAAESSSHKWGIFSDTCIAFHLILGDGRLVRASTEENSAFYHAVPGSYGSLGLLVLAEIQLVRASPSVSLRSFKVAKPYTETEADFLDGIAFRKDLTVMIEGSLTDKAPTTKHWYFEEAKKEEETILPLTSYLFRYDPGAFWMGAYLFKLPFLSRFIAEGLLKLPSKPYFSQKTLQKMQPLPKPGRLWLNLMTSQRLWKLHHKAEKWVEDRLIIQDFCMPASKGLLFLQEAMDEPGVFPIWLCPIKQSPFKQIFAPHGLEEPILNVGLYGVPNRAASMETLMRDLERKTQLYGGRKVLYSRSYYTQAEFWQIYDGETYKKLRQAMAAEEMWPDITEKVLSV